MPRGLPSRRQTISAAAFFLAVALGFAFAPAARAQSNTRLLLSSGWGAPEHAGFVFGPFSNLMMNEAKEIVFLTTLQGTKSELRAVVRSAGVTFSVVAFEGLRSPVPKATYESFSAPSMNTEGVIAFTATLKDGEDVPAAAIVRVDGPDVSVVATVGGRAPGNSDATFLEFSAPVVDSRGNVLFGARTDGKQPGSGLFQWTRTATRPVPPPAGIRLSASDLLVPAFFSHDEALFIPRGASVAAATEQFFRALANKSFQELKPPQSTDAFELLAARPEEPRVRMLLVLTEGNNVQAGVLEGDPSQPVLARRPPGVNFKPVGRIQAQTITSGGHILFAAAAADQPSDLALYCFCNGQAIRLTSREEFLSITFSLLGRPLISLAGDSQHTVAFVAPGAADAAAIYVTSVP